MEAQKPAEGITVTHDYGDTKVYAVLCSCGDMNHTHTVSVEADEHEVTVITYTTHTTAFWKEFSKKSYNIENKYMQYFHWWWKDLLNGLVNRLVLTKNIWLNGMIEYQAAIIMSQQQALNYAETLKQAVSDVDMLREKNKDDHINRNVL